MSASVELLKAARAKISDPKRWARDWWAKDKSGNTVMPLEDAACSWCALGAVYAVGGTSNDAGPLWDAAARYFDGKPPALINDQLGHPAVMRLYDLAIAEVEESNA